MGNRRKLSLLAFSAVRQANSRGLRRIPSNFGTDFPSNSVLDRRLDLSGDPPRNRRPVVSETRVLWRSFCSSKIDNGGVGEAPRCWNCAATAESPGPFLACGSCGSVQPLDESVDYFEIFGLKRAYDIEDGNLERKYKDWQKKLHPDLVHSKSEKEKAFAAEQSARVIDAYHTLTKPLLRALYLLKLEGIHVDEEKTVTDPDLLVEMMDIREAVEEADDARALKNIQSQIQGKFEAWSSSFQRAFQKQDFDDAITSTQRMRYYERALEEIVKKL